MQFHQASVAAVGLPPNSQDFGYSLVVLHHVPDTAAAIRSCAALLKPGAPLLLYLYYAFDNRPRWFRWLWRLSNAARLLILRLPPRPKQLVTDLIALTIYWPLSRLASLADPPACPWLEPHRRPRSLRNALGAALQPRPDPRDVQRRWVGGAAVFCPGSLLVRGWG